MSALFLKRCARSIMPTRSRVNCSPRTRSPSSMGGRSKLSPHPFATSQLGGPDTQRRFAENLFLHFSRKRQGAEVFQILFHVRHARPRPIGSEQGLVRDLV